MDFDDEELKATRIMNGTTKSSIEKFKKYYFISHCVNCEPSILCRMNIDTTDESRIAEGNAYKTKLEAEKALEKYKEEYLKKYGTLILEDTWKRV